MGNVEEYTAATHGYAPLNSSQAPTADHWREQTDPQTGRKYYCNTETKQTQWTKPDGFEANQHNMTFQDILNLDPATPNNDHAAPKPSAYGISPHDGYGPPKLMEPATR